MPSGVFINAGSVLAGGIIGALAGSRIPKRINAALTGIFGLSAMTMGISLIIQMKYLSAVILSLILGTLVGECLNLEESLSKGLASFATRLPGNGLSPEQADNLISMIILFCFSGTGLFGAMNSAITGDHSILITKAIMDFFTAIIFGATTGYLVSMIAVPQFLIGVFLFYFGSFLLPFLTDFMICDFKSVGGIITMAVGLKISKIRHYHVLNMIPALILAFFLSGLWDKLPF